MSGRLQVFALAVAMVTLGGSAHAQLDGREISNLLNELANRCRSLAGEQAAADLINIQTTLMNCTNMQQLYAEVEQEWPDRRKVLEVICGKKDRLLTCGNEGLQILERCLHLEEKKYAEPLYQILEASGNFLCNNTDDIANMAASVDDRECASYVGGKTQYCKMQALKTNEGLQLDDYMVFTERLCKQTKEIMRCMTDDVGDKCKDSSFLRMVKSYENEVLDAISCPDRGRQEHYDTLDDISGPGSGPLGGRGGAAGLLALGTPPTGVVVPLAMCLAALRILHLQ